jgi:5'(3')-deoxyribonucleotidase
MNILLDLDGVLADFLSLALEKLNNWNWPDGYCQEPTQQLTPEIYARIGKFDIAEVYGISADKFWEVLEYKDRFWCNLKPFPWARELYRYLSSIGQVTICTSPSLHPTCPAQKIEWVQRHLGLRSSNMMIGSRKYLMAKPGNVLIDDYPKNVEAFRTVGGDAILVPSNWNTNPLTYNVIRECIAAKL